MQGFSADNSRFTEYQTENTERKTSFT